MLERSVIAIAAPGFDAEHRRRLVRQLGESAWPEGDHPPVEYAPLESLEDPNRLASVCDALLVVQAEQSDPVARRLIDDARASGVAVLQLGGSLEPRDGSLRLAGSAPGEVVAAALCGLIAGNRECRRLHRELEVADRISKAVQGAIGGQDQELRMAGLLQQEFLPELPIEIGGCAFAALWRPASTVSGDMFDIHRLGEFHVGVFLVDAVGHGVPAALEAMMLCRALEPHGHIASGTLSPAAALGQLNDLLIGRRIRGTRHAAALYAVIDCRSGETRVASAGCPAPILLGATRTQILDTSGHLLGLVEGAAFEEISLTLHTGESLCFHSDGFEEAMPTGDPADPPADSYSYVEAFGALRDSADPSEGVRAVSAALDAQSGSLHQRDDCTLVVVRAGAQLPAAA